MAEALPEVVDRLEALQGLHNQGQNELWILSLWQQLNFTFILLVCYIKFGWSRVENKGVEYQAKPFKKVNIREWVVLTLFQFNISGEEKKFFIWLAGISFDPFSTRVESFIYEKCSRIVALK
jgi:hypothetical protein